MRAPTFLSGLKWSDDKFRGRDVLSDESRRVRVFVRASVCPREGERVSLSRRAGPHDIELVSPRGDGANIDPSPVSRSYCWGFRSAPWCRSYRDLAEAQSYNPLPFAPQETLVILHPGITASEALTAISYSGMRRSLRKVGSASGVHNKVR